MPRTFARSPPPTTVSAAAPISTPPAVPNPTPSSVSFYTALPLVLACQSSPPQWKLIQHCLSDPNSASHIPQLPALHLLLQLATLNHTLAHDTSPLFESLLSASTSSTAMQSAVHRICRHIQQLAACHSAHTALNRANSELTLHFKHQIVLQLTQRHTTLRQQLLDDVTHALLPPASIHPLVRSFYSELKRGRASMGDYMQQHSHESFKQQWTAYADLLLHTPTLSTMCQQLKNAHSEVLTSLLSAPANEVAVAAKQADEQKESSVGDSMDVEFEGEYVTETQLYEWLRSYRQLDDVGEEWRRIKDGTHETIVAWKAQREPQSVQQTAAAANA